MKKGIIIAVITAVITAGSVFVVNKTSHSNEDDIIIANIEALQYEELPNGVIIHCDSDVCIIFEYRNRLFLSGCKAEAGSTCTVKKTELPDIHIGG